MIVTQCGILQIKWTAIIITIIVVVVVHKVVGVIIIIVVVVAFTWLLHVGRHCGWRWTTLPMMVLLDEFDVPVVIFFNNIVRQVIFINIINVMNRY